MPFQPEHESFTDQPPATATVWRYMDLARYLSLLENEALHFAQAEAMTDRWEGAYGAPNRERRPTWLTPEIDARDLTVRSRMRSWFRTHAYLNCWHLGEYESVAMWDIYQREGRGVAVRSTWGSLTASITDPRPIFGARVKYIDYTSTYIPEDNNFDAYVHKRLSFEHEKEVRLAALREAESKSPSAVVPISVDLNTLIQSVYVAPDAPSWVADTIESVSNRYPYNINVLQSDLASDPLE